MQPETARCKHIFLDVVGFTRDRSVEAQTDIVSTLNRCVRDVLNAASLPDDSLVLIPTGDGMCISIIGTDSPYDMEMQVAIGIATSIAKHNGQCDDVMRQFEVRIGIDENLDNLVIDINGNRNIAGAGISTASRIMDFAEGQQILVGQTIYNRLRQREHYMKLLCPFQARGKHGVLYNVYQYTGEDFGLNIDIPTAFRPIAKQRKTMPIVLAYYIAYAFQNRQTLLKHKEHMDAAAATILLWFLATDAERRHSAKATDQPLQSTLGGEDADFEQRLQCYEALHWAVRSGFARFVSVELLVGFEELFDDSVYFGARYPNSVGVARLELEWPSLASEFGLSEGAAGV